MRKFLTLFVIVAVLAMSASAFAAAPDAEKWITSLAHSQTESNMSGITTVKEPDKDPKTDGEYSAKIYYYGEIGDGTKKATASVKLTQGDSSAVQFYALPLNAEFDSSKNKFGGTDDEATRTGELELTTTTPATFTFGVKDSTGNKLDDSVTKAILTLTPEKIDFSGVKLSRTMKYGKSLEMGMTVPLLSQLDNFANLMFDKALKIVDGGTLKDSVTINGVTIQGAVNGATILKGSKPDKYGKITVQLKAVKGTTLKGHARPSVGSHPYIYVANFATDGDVDVVTLEIDVADFIVYPQSFTYVIPTSADSAVSFDIDMPIDDFDNISLNNKFLVTSKDLTNGKGTKSGITVEKHTEFADADTNIIVTLGKDYLNDLAAELSNGANGGNEKVTFVVTDVDKNTAQLVVTFVQDQEDPDPDPDPENDPIRPQTPAERNAVDKIVENSDVYGLGTEALTGIVKGMVPNYSSDDLREVFHVSDAISGVEIVVPVQADKDEFVVIPQAQINESLAAAAPNGSGQNIQIVKRFVDPDDWTKKTFVDYTFPSDFVKVTKGTGTDPDKVELNAMVIVADAKAPASAKARTSEWHQGAFDDQGLILTTIDDQNVVIVYDGSPSGSAVDPIYAKAASKNSSSGACDAGFGLVAIAGLAALAIRRRRR